MKTKPVLWIDKNVPPDERALTHLILIKDNQMRVRLLALPLVSLLFILNGCATLGEGGASRLDLIKRRTELRCGVSGKIPGFSFLQRDGSFAGMDVDICRAFAAAFTGSPDQVQYRSLTAPERFTALRTGEIDLLSRNTTFNLSRDAAGGNGVSFAPVVFHDGQGLLVKRNSGIDKLSNLKGKTICVGSGTTTEQNLNDAFQARGIDYKPVKYQDLNQVIAGYLQGRCSAMTSDRSQLAAARSGFNNPEQHVILPEVLSKEPLAPLAAGGDQRLTDAMRWVIYALIAAEELGINQQNIGDKVEEAKRRPELTQLRRFLGIEGDLGQKLGLNNDFIVNVIQAVGNYGEIYDRHLGPKSAVPIPRGLNHLHSNGGVLTSPPFQ
ncbi:ABC-type transporter, periplasmic subunit family 3 [Synechococcus sp. WH 8016]|nr:ABC-type transporter, periplasmic subunit family 3 [Synechococcus sp. WH 8016]